MNKLDKKNMVFFGLGTIGRDMFYAFIANALIYYLSNVLDLPLSVFIATSTVFTILRVVDALNDPLMGLLIDNARPKKSKYKPPLILGGLVGAVCYMVIFTDFNIRDYRFVIIFAVAYLLWDIFYGLNDIAYWSMLPSLTVEQKVREKMGAFSRICANVGMFAVIVAWQPLTQLLGDVLGDEQLGWFFFALGVTVLMAAFSLFTILGVKEKREMFNDKQEKTTLKGLVNVFAKNDQLLWTTLSMSFFTIGYLTTTTFAIYYMEYVFGDVNMYAVLAAVLGVAQITALIIFPLFSKHFSREKLYLIATVLVVIGYAIFWVGEAGLLILAAAAIFLFVGQAFIQLLMLMFLADTIEYGQWKIGTRNESLIFSVQPFINKIGGAVSMGIVSFGIVASGIKRGDVEAVSIPDSGQLVLKVLMLIVPLLFIIVGYIIYRGKFKITKETYEEIVKDLKDRGQLVVRD